MAMRSPGAGVAARRASTRTGGRRCRASTATSRRCRPRTSSPRAGARSSRARRRRALGADPAEHDVARRLEEALALDDPLAVVGEPAPPGVRLEHRRLGLLDLEEQRVGVVASEHQRDPAPGADAADPDDLAGEVDQPVRLEQVAAVGLQRAAVRRGCARPATPRSSSASSPWSRSRERDDERRVALDAVLAVDLLGELGERLHVVLRLRLGQVLLEPLDLLGRDASTRYSLNTFSTSRRAYQTSRFVIAANGAIASRYDSTTVGRRRRASPSR